MKRTDVMLRCCSTAASAILSLAVLAGCSESAGTNNDGDEMAIGDSGLTKSEFRALKKANPNPKNFEKALMQKKLAQSLGVEDGFLETKSKKAKKRPR